MRTKKRESGILTEEAEYNSKKERRFDLGFADCVGDRTWGHFGQRKLYNSKQDTGTLRGEENSMSSLW